jgi:CubicO group peptidase (beta-lactamase class C family)
MTKNILLLFCSFFLVFTLQAQKKGNPKKVVTVSHTVRKVPPVKFPKERTDRLAQREGAMQSLVVLKNKGHILPLGRIDTLKILLVSVGLSDANGMAKMINRYVKTERLTIDPKGNPESIKRALSKIVNYNLVILAMEEPTAGKQLIPATENGLNGIEEKISAEREKYIPEEILARVKIIELLFGSQKFVGRWSEESGSTALVVSDKADHDRMDLASQLLFGAIPSNGKLSFDLSKYKKGDGVPYGSINRLAYILPEEVGIDSLKLAQRMDSLVGIGIRERAFPGCQLLLAKEGKVFYQKSYGYHTYSKGFAVQDDDIYDLASVTKILAPVPALMMLSDQQKFQVNKRMSDYWPDWKGSNKEGILLSDLLSHQARLRPGVILWPRTVDSDGRYKPGYFTSIPTPGFDLRVSNGLYLVNSYPDTVYKAIKDSPLLKTKKYAYSDLGFVIFPKVVENLSGELFEIFLHKRLYAKLGASSLTYLPALSVPRDKIVPTEDDQEFRHEILQGFVHDETAALLGGISGNAGLFGTVGDVAKVMQLYLQNGEYGNERFIKAETLKNWTSSHIQKINNRRGYGFDKPGIRINKHSGRDRYPSDLVSEQSFGHSGYTGTFVWADPANQLLFVFLSNRVFPDRDNHKITKLRLRPLLLEALFKMAGKSSDKH